MPGERARLLAVAEFPEADASRFDEDAEAELERLIEAVTALRRYRDEVGAKASASVRGASRGRGYDACATTWRGSPASSGWTASARWRRGGHRADPGRRRAGAAVRGVRRRRGGGAAREEARRPGKEIERAEKKLANEQFVAKAPPAVVEEERRKLEEYREALARLEP